jgi:hypothetical protein
MQLWAFTPAVANQASKVVAHLDLNDADLTALAAGETLAADYPSEGFGLIVRWREDAE